MAEYLSERESGVLCGELGFQRAACAVDGISEEHAALLFPYGAPMDEAGHVLEFMEPCRQHLEAIRHTQPEHALALTLPLPLLPEAAP